MNIIILAIGIIIACPTYAAHPMYIQGVVNFVHPLKYTPDFSVLHGWNEVLQKEPIKEGRGQLTWDKVQQIQDTYRGYGFEYTHAVWQTKSEFVTARKGDCKSYVIAKYKDLREAGAAAEQLNIWSGDYNGTPHLVLVVEISGIEKVLDIMEPDLPLAKDYFYKNFKPSYRFNEQGWDVN